MNVLHKEKFKLPIVCGSAVMGILLFGTGCSEQPSSFDSTPSVFLPQESQAESFRSSTHAEIGVGNDANRAVQLTHCESQCFSPVWSPNGNQIAFFSGEQNGIMLMDDLGGNVRPLVPQTAGWAPVWSPDGKRIAFTRGQGGELYIVGADGSNQTCVSDRLEQSPTTPREFPEYLWSSDGKSLAFVRADINENSLWVMELENGQPRLLLHDPAAIQILGWSSAESIYILVKKDSTPMLYEVSKEGSTQKELADLPAGSMDEALSPGGEYLLYTLSEPDLSTGRLWIMAVETGRQMILFPHSVGFPVWSPDGRRIAFSYAGKGINSEIFLIHPDGSGLVNTTNHAGFADDDPVWSPDGSRLAFVGRTILGEEFSTDDQIFVVGVPNE